MTEFSAAASLEVHPTGLGAARQQIERELGDIEVSVTAAPGGGGRQPRDPQSGRFREIKGVEQRLVEQTGQTETLVDLAEERNDLLEDLADVGGFGGGGGGGGSGILPGGGGGGGGGDNFFTGLGFGAGASRILGMLSGLGGAPGFVIPGGGDVTERMDRPPGESFFAGDPIVSAFQSAIEGVQFSQQPDPGQPDPGAGNVGAFGISSTGPIFDSGQIAESAAQDVGSTITGLFGGGGTQDVDAVDPELARSEVQRFLGRTETQTGLTGTGEQVTGTSGQITAPGGEGDKPDPRRVQVTNWPDKLRRRNEPARMRPRPVVNLNPTFNIDGGSAGSAETQRMLEEELRAFSRQLEERLSREFGGGSGPGGDISNLLGG